MATMVLGERMEKMGLRKSQSNGATAPPKKPKASKVVIELPKPDIRDIQIKLVGTSPLICHRFSDEQLEQIEAKQQQKAKGPKGARDPEKEWKASLYTHNGKNVFPASGFKKCAVAACSFIDKQMMNKTKSRGAFFVFGQHGSWVEIVGKPRRRDDIVRIGQNKSADPRYRAEFPEWSCVIRVRYNANVISESQIYNLLAIAGFSVGIGDWRPEKGGSFGMFRIA